MVIDGDVAARAGRSRLDLNHPAAVRREHAIPGGGRQIYAMGPDDADIRWSGTTQARKALSDNEWYMAQASMYNEAAAAQYAKALYLRMK